MLSTAKATAVARDLKEALEKRGFVVVASKIGAEGEKLVINTDQMSIRIKALAAIGVDIFGSPLRDFTPHEVLFSIDDGASSTDVAKVMIDLGKQGFGLKIGEGATLGAAETAADAADVERHNSQWPTKGS